MKVTKSYLKQVIKEELNSLKEAPSLPNDVIEFTVDHNNKTITATLNSKNIPVPQDLQFQIRKLLLSRPRE